MTNLDPRFVHLPIPSPCLSHRDRPNLSRQVFKKQLRLRLLRLAGWMIRGIAPPSPLWRVRGARDPKLLLIRPDHLGDLLFLTPALKCLREALPQAQISLMIGSWGKPVLQHNPHIDQLLTCEFPGFTRQPKESLWQPYHYLWQQAKYLRRHQFDMAVVLRFDHWWGAWLAAAAQIPHRIGYAMPEVTPFLTQALSYIDQRHEVEQNWHLLQFALKTAPIGDRLSAAFGRPTLGGPTHCVRTLGLDKNLSGLQTIQDEITLGPLQFFVTADDETWADAWLRQHKIDRSHRLIIMHLGAGAAVKFWREEAWAELGQILLTQSPTYLILSGHGAEEVALCERIATAISAKVSPAPFIAAGQCTLHQLAALMAKSDLALGSDTGPLKLAAAVGTKTLQFYGPVDAIKFGPWGSPQDHRYLTSGLSCIPCNYLNYTGDALADHYCIKGLSVEAVEKAIRMLCMSVSS